MSQPRSQRVGLVGENHGNEDVDVKAWSITLNPCCVTLQVNTYDSPTWHGYPNKTHPELERFSLSAFGIVFKNAGDKQKRTQRC